MTAPPIAMVERVLQTIVRMRGEAEEKILATCTRITRDPTTAASILRNLRAIEKDPSAAKKIPFGPMRTTYLHALKDWQGKRTKRVIQPTSKRTRPLLPSAAHWAQGTSSSTRIRHPASEAGLFKNRPKIERPEPRTKEPKSPNPHLTGLMQQFAEASLRRQAMEIRARRQKTATKARRPRRPHTH